MLTKTSILVTILLAAVILVANAAPSVFKEIPTKNYVGNNLIVGDVLDGTRLLARQYVYKEAKEGRIVISSVTVTTQSNITLLTVLEDRNEAFFSAFPVLVSGGPGSTSATVRFTSWVNTGISFTVTAYGSR